MCLVAIAIDQSSRFPLVLASNRDEFFHRPSEPLGWWTPQRATPDILGGRDLQSGGTWLGLTTAGRLALLTNVRGAAPHEPDAPTRGRIVTQWLEALETTADFWTRIALSGHNGFNLLVADFRHRECFWASNVGGQPVRLTAGLYGLSNAGLDVPWPKVANLKTQLRSLLDEVSDLESMVTGLFNALGDRSVAADDSLPRTGIPLVWERQLSAAFIRTPDERYGTRCSTVVVTERVEAKFITHVLERSFDAHGELAVVRTTVLENWPPRPGDGGLVEVVERLALPLSPRRGAPRKH